MTQSIAKEFRFFSLLRFALPTIISMVFMSLYSMVDGIFVSRMIGTSALSAINIVYPVLSLVIAIGVMLATGGSAIIAKKSGEGKEAEARENFTFLVLVGVIIGVVIMLLCQVFDRELVLALGANDAVYEYCFWYAKVVMAFAPFTILQLIFQNFFVTDGKPQIGLIAILVGGSANVILDYVFIGPMQMGVAGAALATGIGMAIPSIVGIVYFWRKRKTKVGLYFVKCKADKEVFWRSCSNGSSEMVSNLAMAICTFLYNILLMKLMGEDGVAAITIMLYVQFFINAVFMGYSMGIAPVISFHYGSKNQKQIKRLFFYSMVFVGAFSVVAYGMAFVLEVPFILVFAERGSNVYQIAMDGFGLFSLNFIFAGFNIFASAMFTAFSNGKVSAIISFLRTFVFIVAGLLLLPLWFGVNGIWVSMSVAEAMTLFISFYCFYRYRKTYEYDGAITQAWKRLKG